jgi:integrase/recombinase XerD
VPTNYRILQNREKYIQTIKVLTTSEIQNLYLTAEQLFPQMSHQHQIPRRAIATLILDLCYGCGMRKEEAIKLQIKDIDFDKNTIFINQAKGYKDRFIPINTTISKRLQLFIYEHRRFFNVSHERIFPLSKGSMEYYIKQLKNQSDYASIREKNTSLHMLRHSIATHLLQNGMNIEQIAKFLGHNSLESTQIYTHLIHEK